MGLDRLVREKVASLYGSAHNSSRLTGVHPILVNDTPVSAPVDVKLPSYMNFLPHLPGMNVSFPCNFDMPCFSPGGLRIICRLCARL